MLDTGLSHEAMARHRVAFTHLHAAAVTLHRIDDEQPQLLELFLPLTNVSQHAKPVCQGGVSQGLEGSDHCELNVPRKHIDKLECSRTPCFLEVLAFEIRCDGHQLLDYLILYIPPQGAVRQVRTNP